MGEMVQGKNSFARARPGNMLSVIEASDQVAQNEHAEGLLAQMLHDGISDQHAEHSNNTDSVMQIDSAKKSTLSRALVKQQQEIIGPRFSKFGDGMIPRHARSKLTGKTIEVIPISEEQEVSDKENAWEGNKN